MSEELLSSVEADSPLLQFPWPRLPGGGPSPIWTGTEFQIGTRTEALLSYEPADSGWSDELTAFHEDTAGSDHPIDRASRELALQGLGMVTTSQPIVLEIGCSSGYMLLLARERIPATSWIGSDSVRAPLDHLSQHLGSVPLLHFDLRQCPLPDNSVDAVLMLNVLEHIDDDARAMLQVRRILRPGGVAVIEVPAGPALYDVYDQLLMHYRRYTAHGLQQLIRNAGLDVVRMSHLGALLYPAFYIVKRWNRQFLSRERALQRDVVAQEIRSTRGNPVLRAALTAELALGRHFSWPFGIRCAAVGRKPARLAAAG